MAQTLKPTWCRDGLHRKSSRLPANVLAAVRAQAAAVAPAIQRIVPGATEEVL